MAIDGKLGTRLGICVGESFEIRIIVLGVVEKLLNVGDGCVVALRSKGTISRGEGSEFLQLAGMVNKAALRDSALEFIGVDERSLKRQVVDITSRARTRG